MLLSLIKLNFKMLFSGVFMRYRRGKKMKLVTKILIGLLAVYIFGALFLTVGLMFYNLSGVFFELGIGWFYFALAGLMIFALCFIGSFFMVQSQLFAARDNELLLSMPIKPLSILAGRLSALLLTEYLFEIIIFIPVFAVLIISGFISEIPVLGIIMYVLSGILLPLPALAIGCLFGWIVASVTAKMRRKNILTFVFTLAFLFAYLWGYSKLTEYMNILVERGAEIAEAVKKALFPAYHLGRAAADGSVLSFVIFAICALAPFIIMCALLSHSFVKIATSNRGAKKIEYKETALQASGVFPALVKKEFLRFFSTPMYILNSSLGAIFALAAAGVLIVRPALITDTLSQMTAAVPGLTQGVLAALVLAGLTGFNYISAPTISLEGTKLWIIKSLPIPAKTVLLSKLAPHVLVGGLSAVLAGCVCLFRLSADGAAETALLFALPLSVTLFTGLFGVTLNLLFPRFDWLNELQPIKQGVSSMLTMFGAMALIMALALLYIFLLDNVFTLTVYMLLCAALLLILSAGLWLYLISAGVRRFESLDS